MLNNHLFACERFRRFCTLGRVLGRLFGAARRQREAPGMPVAATQQCAHHSVSPLAHLRYDQAKVSGKMAPWLRQNSMTSQNSSRRAAHAVRTEPHSNPMHDDPAGEAASRLPNLAQSASAPAELAAERRRSTRRRHPAS